MPQQTVSKLDASMFSDMFKDVHGFRPRFAPTQADIDRLSASYDTLIAEQEEQDRDFLRAESHRTGVQFETMSDYYNYREEQDRLRWQAAQAEWKAEQDAKAAALAERALLSRPGIAATIFAWEHGDI